MDQKYADVITTNEALTYLAALSTATDRGRPTS
jgi:hypothetical protein